MSVPTLRISDKQSHLHRRQPERDYRPRQFKKGSLVLIEVEEDGRDTLISKIYRFGCSR